MTILFFTRRFYPQIGGVEKHVYELGKKLIQKGHKITVVTENISDLKNYKVEGVNVYSIPTGSDGKLKKFRIWWQLWKLRLEIKKSDIVHCHDVFFWYLPFRFLYPFKRVYTTFHGYESYPIKRKAILIRKISEKLSNGNICIGDFMKKWYGSSPTLVSYGAVEIPKSQKLTVKSHSALFFGRLDDQTCVLNYIKAYEILKKKYPDFKLTIIGNGQYKTQIQKNLNVIPFQPSPEKYFSTHHFAFISRYLSILEAFAARRLVFALYDNPVKEDYLRMSPFARLIIIEKDPAKLTQKIEYYLTHPKKEKELTDKAYEWSKLQSWDVMAKKYLYLWNKK